jgi:phosphomannomutase
MAETIKFGTDGWRAVIADDFTYANVRRIADATGQVLSADHPGGLVLVGYDTRFEAGSFAAAVASVLSAHGLQVRLSDRFLPTPALSWATDRSDAIGAVMLTASHNPAEYCGFKIKTGDGGSAPPAVTARVEAALPESDPGPGSAGVFDTVNLVADYLEALKGFVDGEAIRRAGLKVVVDPLYGAGQGFLAAEMRDLGVDVIELHADFNPSFGGLHPEPIPPHIDELIHVTTESGRDAGFTTDGDADRIGAVDASGAFVNPQRIFALVVRHLVEDRGMSGAVVKTLSTSVLVDRIAGHLGLEVRTTPVGFKLIYEQMVAGGVLIGGEESGGIGIPAHVRERDGLLMALLLAEMMAQHGKGLSELVDDLFSITGPMEYRRVDMRLDQATKESFLAAIPTLEPSQLAGRAVSQVVRMDGVKFMLPDDAWLLLRPSGTEPLVRVYAEAPTTGDVDELLAAGESLVSDPSPR